ncbi:protein of unknown function [Candidatus Methylacidiphilum fumarolicum]|nr:protein of unknown function [Candidatus Methylacidiphilum fumarolicum]
MLTDWEIKMIRDIVSIAFRLHPLFRLGMRI